MANVLDEPANTYLEAWKRLDANPATEAAELKDRAEFRKGKIRDAFPRDGIFADLTGETAKIGVYLERAEYALTHPNDPAVKHARHLFSGPITEPPRPVTPEPPTPAAEPVKLSPPSKESLPPAEDTKRNNRLPGWIAKNPGSTFLMVVFGVGAFGESLYAGLTLPAAVLATAMGAGVGWNLPKRPFKTGVVVALTLAGTAVANHYHMLDWAKASKVATGLTNSGTKLDNAFGTQLGANSPPPSSDSTDASTANDGAATSGNTASGYIVSDTDNKTAALQEEQNLLRSNREKVDFIVGKNYKTEGNAPLHALCDLSSANSSYALLSGATVYVEPKQMKHCDQRLVFVTSDDVTGTVSGWILRKYLKGAVVPGAETPTLPLGTEPQVQQTNGLSSGPSS